MWYTYILLLYDRIVLISSWIHVKVSSSGGGAGGGEGRASARPCGGRMWSCRDALEQRETYLLWLFDHSWCVVPLGE